MTEILPSNNAGLQFVRSVFDAANVNTGGVSLTIVTFNALEHPVFSLTACKLKVPSLIFDCRLLTPLFVMLFVGGPVPRGPLGVQL